MATDVVRRLTFSAALSEDLAANLMEDEQQLDDLDIQSLQQTIDSLQTQLSELEIALGETEAQAAGQITQDAAQWYCICCLCINSSGWKNYRASSLISVVFVLPALR